MSSLFHSPSNITPPWTQDSFIHFWGTRRQNALRRVISIVSGTLEFILLDSWTISLTRSGLKEFNSFTNRTCLVWGSLEFWTLDTIILWVDLEFLWGELTSFVHVRVISSPSRSTLWLMFFYWWTLTYYIYRSSNHRNGKNKLTNFGIIGNDTNIQSNSN